MNADSICGETVKFKTLEFSKSMENTDKVTWRFLKEFQDTDSDDVKDAYSRIMVTMDSEYNTATPTVDENINGRIWFGKVKSICGLVQRCMR